MTHPTRPRFASLQGGRFVAALLVALFHIEGAVTKVYGPYPLNDLFSAGHAGVEYFFVLSGFLIYLVHRRDLETSKNAFLFLKKRAVRILPMYWLAFGCFLGGILVFPSLIQGRILSWPSITFDLLLLPRSGEMILGVAWTLRHELAFYLIFALGIFIPKAGLKPILIWQIAVLINLFSPTLTDNSWANVFFNVYNLGFGAGILVARQLEHPATKPILTMTVGAITFLGLMALERSNEGHFFGLSSETGAALSTVAYTVSASLIILSLAQLETKFTFRALPTLELLGGASYAFYLFHGIVSSSFIRLLHMIAPTLIGWVVMIVTITFTIFCVIVIHTAIEAPLLRALSPRKPSPNALQPT